MQTSSVPALLGLALALAAGLAAGVWLGRSRGAAAVAGLRAERDAAVAERDRLAGQAERHQSEVREASAELARVQAQLMAERHSGQERLEQLRDDQQRLVEQFEALAASALRRNNEAFLTLADERLKASQQAQAAQLDQRTQAVQQLVTPLQETLGKVEGQLKELEAARAQAYTALTEQVGFVRQTSEQLRTETAALVTALRAPQARGAWGEMQLRRVVEMAGMVEHCDFVEQVSLRTDDGLLRPDLVVRLAGDKQVVVDSKVSLSAFLEAAETADPDHRADRLAAHARHLRTHVDDLAKKAYWAQFSNAPEFVVLFVPGEAFLAPALEVEPALLEHAMTRRVIIATPTTLVALLRTVGYAWQQAALTDNARAVFELGRELYDRLARLGDHVDKLGRSIGRVVGDYNAAVGSLESRVLVTARKLKELKVVEVEIPSPLPVDEALRPLGAAELVASAEDARALRAVPAPSGDELDLGLVGGTGDVALDLGEDVADPRYGVPAPRRRGQRASGDGP